MADRIKDMIMKCMTFGVGYIPGAAFPPSLDLATECKLEACAWRISPCVHIILWGCLSNPLPSLYCCTLLFSLLPGVTTMLLTSVILAYVRRIPFSTLVLPPHLFHLNVRGNPSYLRCCYLDLLHGVGSFWLGNLVWYSTSIGGMSPWSWCWVSPSSNIIFAFSWHSFPKWHM